MLDTYDIYTVSPVIECVCVFVCRCVYIGLLTISIEGPPSEGHAQQRSVTSDNFSRC